MPEKAIFTSILGGGRREGLLLNLLLLLSHVSIKAIYLAKIAATGNDNWGPVLLVRFVVFYVF